MNNSNTVVNFNSENSYKIINCKKSDQVSENDPDLFKYEITLKLEYRPRIFIGSFFIRKIVEDDRILFIVDFEYLDEEKRVDDTENCSKYLPFRAYKTDYGNYRDKFIVDKHSPIFNVVKKVLNDDFISSLEESQSYSVKSSIYLHNSDFPVYKKSIFS